MTDNPQLAAWMAAREAVMIPLDELHADAAYLAHRVHQGSLSPDELAKVIRAKIDAAIRALPPPDFAAPAQFEHQVRMWRDGNMFIAAYGDDLTQGATVGQVLDRLAGIVLIRQNPESVVWHETPQAAAWQPPPEGERPDGFRCWCWYDGAWRRCEWRAAYENNPSWLIYGVGFVDVDSVEDFLPEPVPPPVRPSPTPRRPHHDAARSTD